MMDLSTVWQWRIRHVKKHSKCSDPFKHSHVIGVDFDVGSIKKRKVDLKFVTNVVIIEICDFARIVTRGKKHFIANILENNFNLGLENEQQRVDFTNKLASRVEDLLRKPSTNKHEVFPLFDTLDDDGKNKNELNMEGLSEEMDKAHVKDIKCRKSVYRSKEHSEENVLVSTFPYCDKIGLKLGLKTKQNLDQGLLTKGVMLEVAYLAKALCGSYNAIILKVLEHNFELDLRGQEEKNQVLFRITTLTKRTKQLMTSINQVISTFKNEQFPFHTMVEERNLFNKDAQQSHLDEVTKKISVLKGKKQKRTLVDTNESIAKRCRREQLEHVPHQTGVDTLHITDGNSLTWLSKDYNRDLAIETDSNNVEKEIYGKSEPSCDSIQNPFLTTGNSSSSLPSGDPPLPSYLHEMNQCVFQELTHTSTNAHNVRDMEKNNNETTVLTEHEEKTILVTDESVSKREQSGYGDYHGTDLGSGQIMPADDSYMCPLTESDLDSDGETDSRNVEGQNEKDLFCSLSSEAQKKSESSCVDFQKLFLSVTDGSSSSPSVKAPPGGYSDDKKSSEGCEQTHRLGNIFNGCDMELEEIETEDNMWKMRAKRVKNILSEMSLEFGEFNLAFTNLEFDMGFGAKKNLSCDHLTNKRVVEVARFAIAINSSQQDFITEILEKNFDLKLENDLERSAFAYETITRVGKLLNSEHIKFSKELFKLPLPMLSKHITNENMGNVSTELPSASGEMDCNSKDCSQHSLPKATANVSEKSDDPYHFCKEIGLKLVAKKSQPVKLDVNTLTNGAMVEVANFAEKLCGTFEQIFFDVLRHNFDLESQNDYSDLVKNIPLYIPLIVEQNNLSLFPKYYICKMGLSTRPILTQLLSPSIDVDTFSSGSSQTPAMNHNVASSIESEQQNEPSQDDDLWKLRADRIQQILSRPHEHHCPLYPYPRCKKIGMDFNLASGVKPNLNPALLTNGLMVEIHTFATALQSAKEHFVTEILEYNFDLDMKNEEYRKSFGKQTLLKLKALTKRKQLGKRFVKFELPNSMEVEAACYSKGTCCPKCNQTTNQKPGQHDLLSSYKHYHHPYVKTEITSAETNCSPQKPFILSAVEKKILKRYPLCMKIGLNLCVNKAWPKKKLTKHFLTIGAMSEVMHFVNRWSGNVNKIINDVLKHYFNIPSGDMNSAVMFNTAVSKSDGCLAWLNEVFFPQPVPHKVLKQREKQNDDSYMCPLTESDFDSDGETDSMNVDLICSLSSEVQKKSESSCVDFQLEKIETEDNMWKMRAKRVKNILSEMSREFGEFNLAFTNLEFDMGFGAKKNLSCDHLTNKRVVEVARFAIAINSSQQDFITEILEKNFDLKLENDLERSAFAYETITRVGKLLNSEHIKFSKELFKLPLPMLSKHITNENMGNVSTELPSASGEMDCNSKDCSQHSLPKATANVSEKSDDPYHFCKEIGLKLVAKKSQPVKLDVNTLTNGAMVEVANFAEKLCGTFEQIFFDVLRHNFDLESQNDYSDLVKNIPLYIPLIVEQNNLSLFPKSTICKMGLSTRPILTQLLSPSIDVDTFSSGSSQTPAMNHNVASSIENEQQNEPSEDDDLWKLRADHIQQILSRPHEHHCPLYPYPRCKKIGMDFNLASGVKPNLDPALLTNGLMVEIHTFATALQSAKEHFVTEILEYNFDLDMKNEEYRKSFGKQTLLKLKALTKRKNLCKRLVQFELPNSMEVEAACYSKGTYCPKCNQTTNQKPGQHDLLSSYKHYHHPYVKTEITSAETNCSPQKPFILSAVEKKILKSYPLCMKIGLNLCVNKAWPKEKLPKHFLSIAAMSEVMHFVNRLSGNVNKIINDVLKHYFNIPSGDVNSAVMFNTVVSKSDGCLAWLNEVFSPQPVPHKVPKQRENQNSEMKSSIQERRLALQKKKYISFMSSKKLCTKVKEKQDVVVQYPFIFSYKSKNTGQNHKQNMGNPDDNTVSSTDHGRTQGHVQIEQETYATHYDDAGPDTGHVYHPPYENVKKKLKLLTVQPCVKFDSSASSAHTAETKCPNTGSGVQMEPSPQILGYYSLGQPLGLQGCTTVAVCPDTVNTRHLAPVVAAKSQECSMTTIRQNYQINSERQNVSGGSRVTVQLFDICRKMSTQTKERRTETKEKDV